ncbi:ABC transporter ATP-binding protein [Candidatus Bathyarchaeota archaeon]|jgi:ABC-2 type transport system ATP-binding protein|nr:ABC transporter ATP-binding protein [Candidatus Bathyarchaeota archaeon]MDP6048442.1 ABC transporter ATP-binding protein [Candidatus Bathyarchaeota archaeon]MDP7443767.1 ABC transporter ATP-binding protein [Candidatus Bathyarchaeota archaeon]|tara:strand:- start:7069 stop:8004 length:936 start_codon:yes stop_codon:yes gene_type:complete
MVENVIETFDLTKRYGDFTAVESLDMAVQKGEIFGFLGPNGAGKTTTILMLMGLSVPTSGKATVAGYDIIDNSREIRSVASVLPEYSSLYGELTAAQNLEYVGKLNDLTKDIREERIGEMLKIVGMSDWADEKYEKFSRGMKQRVGIAATLVKQPKLVFLDEPTLGLDPVATKEVRELIIRLNKEQGLTVVLTSHMLNEVQMTCDRVGIINKGKLIVMETLENLTNDMIGSEERNIEFMLSEVPHGLVRNLEAVEGVKSVTQKSNRLFVYGGVESDYKVSKTITDNGAVILMMKPKEYSMEEIFMKYYEEG